MNLIFNKNNKIGDLVFLGSVIVDPKLAEELLKNNIGNRKINTRRVASYANEMRNKNWYAMPEGLTITVDKEWHILNGQHRLYAIIESQTSVEMYFCQKDINASAEVVVTDVGLNRNLAMLMKVSTNYISTITTTIKMGTNHSRRVTVSDVEKFMAKLTEEEKQLIDLMGSVAKIGVSGGIKAGFFYAYTESHCQRIVNDFEDLKSGNEYNPIMNKLYQTIIANSKGYKGQAAQTYYCNLSYCLLNGYNLQKTSATKDKNLEWFKELYNRIMDRQ